MEVRGWLKDLAPCEGDKVDPFVRGDKDTNPYTFQRKTTYIRYGMGWNLGPCSKESLCYLISNVLQTSSHALMGASQQYNKRQVSTLTETPAFTIEVLATGQ
jgi:hypothetical protein